MTCLAHRGLVINSRPGSGICEVYFRNRLHYQVLAWCSQGLPEGLQWVLPNRYYAAGKLLRCITVLDFKTKTLDDVVMAYMKDSGVCCPAGILPGGELFRWDHAAHKFFAECMQIFFLETLTGKTITLDGAKLFGENVRDLDDDSRFPWKHVYEVPHCILEIFVQKCLISSRSGCYIFM